MSAALQRGTGRIVRSIPELRDLADGVRAAGGRVGFFGTSGNLHEGHLTIVRRMVEECDLGIMPLYEKRVEPVPGLLELSLAGGYDRDGAADLALARSAGVDLVFIPERSHMYPDVPVRTRVVPDDDLAAPWENAEDPQFIRMTATAVLKYWNIVGPCRHYFGEKDWVPLAVLRKMIADFSVPADLVSCPIVREADGLCVSSRNRKLSAEDRAAAPVLYAAIRAAIDLVTGGERDGSVVRDLLRERVGAVAAVDYAEIVDAVSLRRVDPLVGDLRVLVGAEFSGVHLFDNAPVSVSTC